MRIFWNKKGGVHEVVPGGYVHHAITEAIRLSLTTTRPETFEHNGVMVTVMGDSDPDLIYRDWSRSLSHYIGPCVGPYPVAELPEIALITDAVMEKVNERRRQEAEAEYQRGEDRRRLMLRGALVGAPEKMTVIDEEAFRLDVEANPDGMGNAIIAYADRWARLMEVRIANGGTIEDSAEEASHLADEEGITGAMYGCAVAFLSHCWLYGEQLKTWHNAKYGRADAKGVVNPAVLVIG